MVSLILTTTACDNGGKKPNPTDENKEFVWSNPMTYSFDDGKGLRDPFILKVGNEWYLTGTHSPYGLAKENEKKEKTPGVALYKSNKLLEWEYVGIILKSPGENEKDKWYQDRFWAPEIFHHNGLFYLTVNCCDSEGAGHGMLFAVSESIEGPYTIMTEDKPAYYGNDAHLFVDDDGQTYLYGSDIWGAPIDLTSLKLLGARRNPVQPIAGSDAWNGRRDGVGIEGPYILKRNNKYFLFYSTWSRGYEVGYAVSSDPLKDYEMEKDPLYGSINQNSCNHYGGIYEEYYTNQDKYREVGHNSVFLGPDGNDWIVAHAYDYENGLVKYVMDRLVYNEDNTVSILNVNSDEELIGPSYGKQTLKYGTVKESSPVKTLDVWGRVKKGSEYALPKKVDILFDNGWRECSDVVWDSNVNTSSIGEQVVKGTTTYDGVEYEVYARIRVTAV